MRNPITVAEAGLGSCPTGKRGYPTEIDAKRNLKGIRRGRKPHRKERRVYWCGLCGEFHLTKKKKGETW